MSGDVRVGSGLDVHAFGEGDARRLILGGVEVPGAPGLLGHSDADVVAHAVADAVLGAAGLGDLGSVFGVDDPALEGADSLALLLGVVERVAGRGWTVANVDATVVAERPRLGEHLPAMRERVADAVGVPVAAVSVKATSADGLGSIGRGQGIACWAVVLITRAMDA